MESNILNRRFIEKLHAAKEQFGLAITGGGTSVIADLFSVAGASNTLIEVSIPYHRGALALFLGAPFPSGCDTHTARALAMMAFQRALAIAPDEPVTGIGCTAALATNRTRKGDDRCHLAVQNAAGTRAIHLAFSGRLSRQAQEEVIRDHILDAMGAVCGLRSAAEAREGVQVAVQDANPGQTWRALMAGETLKTSDKHYKAVFPGAFNPIHAGHEDMIEYARRLLACDVALEISIRNVDKPPLDFLTMEERRADLGQHELVYTNAPTFEEKSTIFPGAIFIVGADTAMRIADPDYYGGEAARDAALVAIARRGNRFLVFCRETNKDVQSLHNLSLPPALSALCTEVPEEDFRVNINSTDLRAADE